MSEQRALAFACAGHWLYGVANLPPAPHKRGVLIVVGGPQYRAGSHRQFTLLGRSLAAQGIATMRFDYRGMGDSEGERRDFDSVDEDLRAAVDAFFGAAPGLEEVVLWGLCDAASAAALYAAADARVTGLVLLNPWVRTDSGAARATLKHYYRARLLDGALWKKLLRGRLDLAQSFKSFAGLLGSARQAPPPDALPDRMHHALAKFTGKILVLLSGADLTAQEFADLAQASPQWRALMAAPRITRKTIAKADHTCSRRVWHDEVAQLTAHWVRRS